MTRLDFLAWSTKRAKRATLTKWEPGMPRPLTLCADWRRNLC